MRAPFYGGRVLPVEAAPDLPGLPRAGRLAVLHGKPGATGASRGPQKGV